MPELYIDLRNNAVRALLVKKGELLFGRAFSQGVTDGEGLRQLVAVLRSDSGARFSRAHLLLPSNEVTVSQHRTQAHSLADVRLIVGRALALESGEPAPMFLLTRMAAEHNQQVYQAEYLPRPILDKYLRMFRAAGLRLVTVSTACQAQQAFLPEISGEIHQVQALLDIGGDGLIEALFFSNTEILQHELLEVGSGAEEQEAQEDAERNERRKLYGTMNNLHIVYSRFMNQNPQAVLGKLWLAGNGSGVAGLPGVLAEAMGAQTGLLVPDEVKDLPDGQIYATLVGYVRQLRDSRPVNFLPPELSKRFRVNNRLVALVVGALYTLLLLAAVVQIEHHAATLKADLAHEKLTLQGLQSSSAESREQLADLRKLAQAAGKQPPIFEIFRDLTVLLPKGVYLEGLEYSTPPGQGPGEVKLSTAIVYDSEFGSRRLLSKYVAALESSALLARHDEPVISYRTLGEQKLMMVAITCAIPAKQKEEGQ